MSCLRGQFLIKSGYSPQHVLCWTERQQNCQWVGNPQSTAPRLTPPSSALPPFGCFLERGWINLDIRILTWIIRVRCSFGKPSPWHMSTKQIENYLGKLCGTTQSSVCEWVVISHQKCQCVHVISFVSLLVVGNTSGCMKIKGPGMVLPSMVPVKVAPKPLSAQLSSTSFMQFATKPWKIKLFLAFTKSSASRLGSRPLPGQFWSPSNLFHKHKSESPFREPFTKNKKLHELTRGLSTGQLFFLVDAMKVYLTGFVFSHCLWQWTKAAESGAGKLYSQQLWVAKWSLGMSWAGYINIPECIHRIFQIFQNGGTGIRPSLKNIWQNWDIYIHVYYTHLQYCPW